MAYPITWSGASLVSMAASVDSDPIAIPNGTIGFSAIVSVLGGAPYGIGGNLQVCVSETGLPGSYVALVGSTTTVRVSPANTVQEQFTFENQFYNFMLLRWNQAGPDLTGTMFDGAWSISLAPPGPPAPTPPQPAPPSSQPAAGATPASAAQLTGYFNVLFPFRWVQPGSSPVYNAIVSSIVALLGFIGDQVLQLGQTIQVPVLTLPAGSTVTAPVSALQLQLRLRTADAPILDIAIHDFFGDTLPRLPNESNAAYLNRALSILFQPKNTRNAIFNMLTSLTGQPPHIVNPNVPGDVGGLTATKDNVGALVGGKMVFAHGLWSTTTGTVGPPSYLGTDVGGAPLRYANPNGRGTKLVNGIYGQQPTSPNYGYGWQGFIDTTYPLNFGAQGDPVSGYATVAGSDPPMYTAATITGTLGSPSVYTNLSGAGNGFCACSNPQVVTGPDGYAQNVYATVNAGLTGSEGMAELGPSVAWFNPRGLMASDLANGQATVLGAINKLRAEGTAIWARCLPAQFLAAEGFTT